MEVTIKIGDNFYNQINFLPLLNEIIKRVIKEISANKIKILMIGSPLNKPVTNKRPKGSKIIDPFKKMKK